jgi:hypothetical protein
LTQEERDEAYIKAFAAAKFELDEVLPEYNKLRERINALRAIVHCCARLIHISEDDIEEKYRWIKPVNIVNHSSHKRR